MSEFNSYIAHLLLKRMREESLNPSEAADLIQWQEQSDHRLGILDFFEDNEQVADALGELESAPSEKMWENISARTGRKGILRTMFSRPGAQRAAGIAAAVVIILISASTYYWYNHRAVGNLDTKGSGAATSVAGKAGDGNVFLTLADGSKIVLDGKRTIRLFMQAIIPLQRERMGMNWFTSRQ